ncbi:MAG: IS3 family transposase [Acidimicrobiia bacterium]
MIVAFIDAMRAKGHAVEPICRVLTEQGCQVAARTYRAWSRPAQTVAARTLTDALVEDKVRELAWTIDEHGRRRLTPGGLHGRRKMTPLVRRSRARGDARCCRSGDATPWPVGRSPGQGDPHDDPAKDGRRAGDLLNRDFTAPAPNRTWVMDFTYVRTWTGLVYVAFVVDVFAQRIVAWNAATAKDTDLVMAPLRMAIWRRDRDGHPIVPCQLIGHAEPEQYTSIRFTEHLELEGEGVRPSIGSVGDAYDNALMESVIGLYKTECIRTTVFHAGPYRTIGDVEYATAGWVDWYNDRRHSTLDYLTPAEYEQAHYATLNREPHPV